MAKISTYPVDGLISTDDFIIGSDAENVNITKNFTVGGILSLSDLQMVLDNGNTATSNIVLTGNVSATNVAASAAVSAVTGSITTVNATNVSVGNSLNTVDIEVSGLLYDGSASEGTNGQFLKSTGTATQWSNLPVDTLNAVLAAGNTTALNIVSTGDISADAINANAVEADDYTVNSQLSITGTIEANASIGTTGQVLTSQAGTGSVHWTTLPVDTLQAVLDAGNTATEDMSITGTITADKFNVDAISSGTVSAKGDIAWSDERATVEVGLTNGDTMYVGQDTLWLVRANDNIAKGDVVYASGTVGASGKIVVDKYLADGTIPGRFIIGIASQDIAVSEEGYIMSVGKIRNINTTAYTEGDVLWCDPATPGALTNVEPSAPAIKSAMAFVVSAGSNGTIAVRVDNGFVIKDASDVQITNLLDNQILLSNSGVFTNVTPSADLFVSTGGVVDPSIMESAPVATQNISTDASIVIGLPSQWINVTIGGVDYVIPAYLSA